MITSSHQQKLTLGLIFCTLLLAYSYVLPRRVDWSQQSRLSLVRAMVERNTVRINAYVSETGEYAIYNGNAYTEKAPGPSFIGLPLYAVVLPLLEYPAVNTLLTWLAHDRLPDDVQERAETTERIREFTAQYLLTLVVIAIPSAAACVLLYHFLTIFAIDAGLRTFIVLAYGLATPAATYAGNFYSHQLIAVLILSAFILLMRLGRGSGGLHRSLLVGLMLGFAVISEYSSILLVLILGIYAWMQLARLHFYAIVLGAIPPILLLITYDLAAFNTPFPVSYNYSVIHREAYHTGFMGITYPRLEVLWGLTFGPFRGLFVRSPWLLLAVPGFVLWWRNGTLRDELWVVMSITISFLLFYSSAVLWWGGAAAGPRHLVPILPFLAIGTVPALTRLWQFRGQGRRVLRIGLMVLVIGSVILIWSEAVAGHNFPPEDIRATWQEFVVPAWREGYITDNIGTVLGLAPSLSLLPLAIGVAILVSVLTYALMRADQASQPTPVPLQSLNIPHR